MQDYAPKLRTVTADPMASMMKAVQGGAISAHVGSVGALDEITKRIVSGNSRLYDLMLRARAIADAAFGATGSANAPDDANVRPVPATKLAALDEAASVTHRILSDLEIELERLSQL